MPTWSPRPRCGPFSSRPWRLLPLAFSDRTISHPAEASSAICAVVAGTSCVFVVVIDWTTTGAPPPTVTPPTEICRLLAIRNQSSPADSGAILPSEDAEAPRQCGAPPTSFEKAITITSRMSAMPITDTRS